jgi:hypothetical protein
MSVMILLWHAWLGLLRLLGVGPRLWWPMGHARPIRYRKELSWR